MHIFYYVLHYFSQYLCIECESYMQVAKCFHTSAEQTLLSLQCLTTVYLNVCYVSGESNAVIYLK